MMPRRREKKKEGGGNQSKLVEKNSKSAPGQTALQSTTCLTTLTRNPVQNQEIKHGNFEPFWGVRVDVALAELASQQW